MTATYHNAATNSGAGALEVEQLQKIDAEAAVLAEIQELGGNE